MSLLGGEETIDMAMENIKEVIEMCLEETKSMISIRSLVSEIWK
jgi:predicted RNase H-like HicB family nuclease